MDWRDHPNYQPSHRLSRPVSPIFNRAVSPIRPDSAYFPSPLSPIEYDKNGTRNYDVERKERAGAAGRPPRRTMVCGCIEPVFWSILIIAVLIVITAIVRSSSRTCDASIESLGVDSKVDSHHVTTTVIYVLGARRKAFETTKRYTGCPSVDMAKAAALGNFLKKGLLIHGGTPWIPFKCQRSDQVLVNVGSCHFSLVPSFFVTKIPSLEVWEVQQQLVSGESEDYWGSSEQNNNGSILQAISHRAT
ncbi:hypothetical protein HDK90DRAFT_540125 [Phyllosticta capitalensis]|uniref:Uncharacterized protein n=1 Tax=Phyllosticta capitalensis TaxID=121624 RepID=A0ABR1Z4L8_9PEZI